MERNWNTCSSSQNKYFWSQFKGFRHLQLTRFSCSNVLQISWGGRYFVKWIWECGSALMWKAAFIRNSMDEVHPILHISQYLLLFQCSIFSRWNPDSGIFCHYWRSCLVQMQLVELLTLNSDLTSLALPVVWLIMWGDASFCKLGGNCKSFQVFC